MEIMLGTALWGWTTPPTVCYQLLDHFYESGYRQVDAATNYPINKNPSDFRRGEKILAEWIQAHQVSDLEICMKVGSLDNMKSPDHNLSPSFLLFNREQYRQMFGENLACFMIHWDNRHAADDIAATLEVLSEIYSEGLAVGFSGLAHPTVYHTLWDHYNLGKPWMQMKHNLLYSDLPRYAQLADRCITYAYGLNAGGIKLDTHQYRSSSSLVVRSGEDKPAPPPILHDLLTLRQQWLDQENAPSFSAFFEVALLFGFCSPGIHGLILGGSHLQQLQNNLETVQAIKKQDSAIWFEQLLELHRKHAPADRKI